MLIRNTLPGLAVTNAFALACPSGQYPQWIPVNSSNIAFFGCGSVLTIVCDINAFPQVRNIANAISSNERFINFTFYYIYK
jgi:hypothetical protein